MATESSHTAQGCPVALLKIRFKTAACHRTKLFRKVGVRNAIGLFRWAILNGHVSLDGNSAARDK